MKRLSLMAPLMALLLIGIAFVLLPMQPETVTAQSVVSLSPQAHPAGTRILEACAITDMKSLKMASEECVREVMVADWSPSGRFVKLGPVGFLTAGEWKLPRQVRVVELLAVPKAEPVSKQLPEMVLEGGKVRLQ